ncbi:conserved Plasmodium protein, unknown function [Plasmodium gallinaceum]|uniref:Uncharacterized protein n=1 Tax=Plasmodium gallinaceum TaxID=5849 RepID=A0A1J1GMM8_PLAGA|nr:conserved Plasmodium protein, unknown function [Plasmodium gallinaceum]CRG93704.1 conserved Plasmodium protein, unknown function [Plasmodium gallinaceum]
MRKKDSEYIINSTYESCLRKLEENMQKSKLALKNEKEKKINIKDIEFNIKNHMNEMTKLVKEAKIINSSTSNNIKDFYNGLMKCEELCNQLTSDEINQKINETFNNIVTEINNKCKPIVL